MTAPPIYPPKVDLSYTNGEQEPELVSMSEFYKRMEQDAEDQKPLVAIVARLLSEIVSKNDKLPADKEEITVFHAQKAPAVNVNDYAESIMVAAKFLDDFYYSNEFWAKIGGVPNAELNTLELEFLFLTNFDLHVRRQVYDKYRESLLDWNCNPIPSILDNNSALSPDNEVRIRQWPPGCLSELVYGCHGLTFSNDLKMEVEQDVMVNKGWNQTEENGMHAGDVQADMEMKD